MKVVFDSNIYIAGFRTKGFLYGLLLKALNPKSDFFIFISSDIRKEVAEKLAVVAREQVLPPELVKRYLGFVDHLTHRVETKEKIEAVKDDPDDNIVLECAVAAEANIIVTMDKHLLKLKTFRNIAILHPKTLSYISKK